MSWKSTEEELPEIATSVIVYHPGLGTHISFYDGAGTFTHPLYENFDGIGSGVSHWMPLPDPPKHITTAKPDRFATGCNVVSEENYGITGYQEPAKDPTAG